MKQSSLEVYFEWLDSLIERRVAEVSYYHTSRSYRLHKSLHASGKINKQVRMICPCTCYKEHAVKYNASFSSLACRG